MISFIRAAKRFFVFAAVGAALVISAAAADISVGTVVDASSLRLRSEPTTSSSIVSSAPEGENVVILEKVDDWYKVIYDYRVGYMSGEFISVSENGDFEIGTGVVNTLSLNVRETPGTDATIVYQLSEDTVVDVVGVFDGWFKVNYETGTGYIHPDYIDIKNVNLSDTRILVTETAKQYIGTPYVYGGSSPRGFDCSGFVYYIFKSLGYSLPRTATSQMNSTLSITREQLMPGDLVFFNSTGGSGASHVGIYVGNDQFIHSPTPGRTVCIESLINSWYSKYYIGATRVVK